MRPFGILIFFILCNANCIFSQVERIEIKEVKISSKQNCPGCVDIYFSSEFAKTAPKDSIREEEIVNDLFAVREESQGKVSNSFNYVPGSLVNLKSGGGLPSNGSNDTIQSTASYHSLIYLGLDLSGSITPETLERAKEAIISFVTNPQLEQSTIYLYTFNDDISDLKLITSSNYNNVLSQINSTHNRTYRITGLTTNQKSALNYDNNFTLRNSSYYKTYDTDLHLAITSKLYALDSISMLESKEGITVPKALVILTDGRNDTGNIPKYYFGYANSIKSDDVIQAAKKSEVTLYTIGLGNSVDDDFLTSVAKANDKGAYFKSSVPENLNLVYSEIGQEILPDYLVTYQTSDCLFKGLLRTYQISFDREGQNNVKSEVFKTRLGALGNFINTCTQDSNKVWYLGIIYGFVIVLGLFILLALLFPLIKKLLFRARYVKTYKPIPGFAGITCIACGHEIKSGEKIVNKCDHYIHYQCWQEVGNHCPDYPDNCTTGIEESYTLGEFLKGQRGSEIPIWGFSGAVGALLAYTLYKVFFENINILNDGLRELNFLESFIPSLSAALGQGFLLGFFLILMFSLIENKSFLDAKTIGFILLRSFIGGVLGAIVLFFSTRIALDIDLDYFSHVFSLTLFGTAIGASLSIRSGIKLKNGIIGGLVSSFIASNVYYFFSILFKFSNITFLFLVIKFILFGLILGMLISLVLKMLEEFYLEFLAGSRMYTIIPISKWLLSGDEIIVGNSKKCRIALLEEKEIKEEHALLKFDKNVNVCLIKAFPNCEVYINNRLVIPDKFQKLNHEDILTFSNYKLEQLIYREKKKAT